MFKYFPYTTKYYITHPWEWFTALWRSLKYSKQRANRGFCDYDVWDIDTWFLNTTPKMLRQLATTASGYPDHMDGIESFEDWQNTLLTMANYFEQAQMNFDNVSDSSYEEAKTCLNKGMELFTKYFFTLWD